MGVILYMEEGESKALSSFMATTAYSQPLLQVCVGHLNKKHRRWELSQIPSMLWTMTCWHRRMLQEIVWPSWTVQYALKAEALTVKYIGKPKHRLFTLWLSPPSWVQTGSDQNPTPPGWECVYKSTNTWRKLSNPVSIQTRLLSNPQKRSRSSKKLEKNKLISIIFPYVAGVSGKL